jgi:hypothetical protein
MENMDFPIPVPAGRLRRQIAFVLEADKLKDVLRRSYLTSGERRENSGEHSWHTALLAMILAEYSNRSIDVCKVIRMMLIHDLVEIDAGETNSISRTRQAFRRWPRRVSLRSVQAYGIRGPSDQTRTPQPIAFQNAQRIPLCPLFGSSRHPFG